MKSLKFLSIFTLVIAPVASVAHAESPDDIGACYQTVRFSGQTQCNVVERRFCFSTLTISATFVEGGDCS